MKFKNDKHLKFVFNCCEKANNYDCYHKALFYVLGLTENCQNNIDSLYEWETGCVKNFMSNDNYYGWITGTDARIIRLAYNLYNNGCPTAYNIDDLEEKVDEIIKYIPAHIFDYLSSELIEYCFEGIRIRYELA